MITPIQIKATTPQISPSPQIVITNGELPTGCQYLFDVVTTLKQQISDPTSQKKEFREWLIENGCERNNDLQDLIFCNMSPEEYCAKHPEHPACKPIEPPKYPDISVWPTYADFRELYQGEYKDIGFTISNIGGEVLSIYSQNITDGQASAFSIISGSGATNIAPGDYTETWVRFYATNTGEYNSNLEIYSNDTDQQYVYCYLTGEIIQETKPIISVSPTDIDFGQIPMYQFTYKTVTIFNIGNDNLIVSSVTLGPSDAPYFSIWGITPPLTIKPGELYNFWAYFTALTTETKYGTIYFNSNDPKNPTTTVNLKGQGIT